MDGTSIVLVDSILVVIVEVHVGVVLAPGTTEVDVGGMLTPKTPGKSFMSTASDQTHGISIL